jgi:hypothetical protein
MFFKQTKTFFYYGCHLHDDSYNSCESKTTTVSSLSSHKKDERTDYLAHDS